MLTPMDAAQALADLTEISSQVVNVVIATTDGDVLATTIDDEGRAGRFTSLLLELVNESDEARRERGLETMTQLEAATLDGSIFVVRRGSVLVGATTRPDPTVGLVFYDLKHCLRAVAEPDAAPAAARRRKAADATA
jgi:predicted regulator of Ras-like GTPase activity (Roadblock/LC7/MglB family)